MQHPPAPLPGTDVPAQVQRDLRALSRGLSSTPGTVRREHEEAIRIAGRWLSLVGERRRAAEGSPSDQERWSTYAAAVKQPAGRTPDQKSLTVLLGTVRAMLKDLAATEPPCPTVTDIATRIRTMIGADLALYPPGAMLPQKDLLVRQWEIPPAHLELALKDLRDQGALDWNPGGTARVRATGPYGARGLDVAGWLRTLIRTPVYPPGRLPARRELARTLAIGEDPVAGTLAVLVAEGTLLPGTPPRVPPGPSQPFDLETVLRPVAHLPRPEGGPPYLDALARRTRSSWVARTRPPMPQLERDIAVLRADIAHLAPLVHDLYPDAVGVVARAAVTAAEPLPTDGYHLHWRAAGLAIAAQDLLAELHTRSL